MRRRTCSYRATHANTSTAANGKYGEEPRLSDAQALSGPSRLLKISPATNCTSRNRQFQRSPMELIEFFSQCEVACRWMPPKKRKIIVRWLAQWLLTVQVSLEASLPCFSPQSMPCYRNGTRNSPRRRIMPVARWLFMPIEPMTALIPLFQNRRAHPRSAHETASVCPSRDQFRSRILNTSPPRCDSGNPRPQELALIEPPNSRAREHRRLRNL